MSKTTALHVVGSLFSRFPWRPWNDYNVKPPNATFYGGREHRTTNFSFFFFKLNKFLKNSTPGEIAYIWQIRA